MIIRGSHVHKPMVIKNSQGHPEFLRPAPPKKKSQNIDDEFRQNNSQGQVFDFGFSLQILQ